MDVQVRVLFLALGLQITTLFKGQPVYTADRP